MVGDRGARGVLRHRLPVAADDAGRGTVDLVGSHQQRRDSGGYASQQRQEARIGANGENGDQALHRISLSADSGGSRFIRVAGPFACTDERGRKVSQRRP